MTSSSSVLHRVSHLLPSLLGVVLFGLSLWAIGHELREFSPEELLRSLQAIPWQFLLLAIGLTFLNYIALTGYDALALQYIRHRLPYSKTALVSVISYAVSNSVGFALLSGSAIRYRFYIPWGLSATQIAYIIAFCNISFWLGLLTVGGLIFILQPVAVPALLHLPFTSVRPIGGIFLTVILGYLIWNGISQKALRLGSWVLPHLPVKLCLLQLLITSLDWFFAAGVFYTLLPHASAVPLLVFFGVYLLAQLAGVISNVPGGLGVFETVMLLLLSPPISSAELFGALIAYRGIYYFLPLAIAVVLLGWHEAQQVRDKKGEP